MDCPPLSALSVNEDLAQLRFDPTATTPALRRRPRPSAGRCTVRGVRSATPRTRTLPAAARRSRPSPRRRMSPAGAADGPGLGQLLRRDADQGRRGGRRAARHDLATGSRDAPLPERPRRRPARRRAPTTAPACRRATASRRARSWAPAPRQRPRATAGTLRNSLPLAGRQRHALSKRMRSGPAHRNARAKTGTLDDASALSGYVTSRNGHQLVFSILMNHRHAEHPGRAQAAGPDRAAAGRRRRRAERQARRRRVGHEPPVASRDNRHAELARPSPASTRRPRRPAGSRSSSRPSRSPSRPAPPGARGSRRASSPRACP